MPARVLVVALAWFALTGCPPGGSGGPSVWVDPPPNPIDSEAPYGLVVVAAGSVELLRVDNVDGQPRPVVIDLELPGPPDELRFVPYETDVLGEDVGLFVLGAGDASYFVDVAVFSDGDHRADLRELPPGSRPWDVAVGELEWLATSLRGTATVEVQPRDEEPFQVEMHGHADGDGDPELGALAWLDEHLFVALERRQGDDGPPSADGGLLVRVDPAGGQEPIATGDLPRLHAASGPGGAVVLRVEDDAGPLAFDLDPEAPLAMGAPRLSGVDLPGELLGLLVAPDGELLALTGSAAGGGALHCVAAGDDEPTPLLILESTPTQAHLSTTGVLSVALLEGEAGRVDVFGFAGCGADPVLIWSIALSGRPLATAMGGALVLGLL